MKILLQTFALLLLFTNSLFSQDETGLASYYNDKYQGVRTYSGEPYNKKDLTCAHKTYPMGTLLKVTRLDNNKTVEVRVNDRMSSPKRVVDLSRAAAEELDLVRAGTSKVRVEIAKPQDKPIEEALVTKTDKDTEPSKPETPIAQPKKTAEPVAEKPTTKPETASPKPDAKANAGHPVLIKASEYEPTDLFSISLKKPEREGFGVQIAVLSSQEALFKMVADLEEDWFSSVLVNVQKGPKDEVQYKLILGPFETADAANTYKDNLKKNKSINGFVVDLAGDASKK
jgi:rare lipoprotein A